MKRLPAFPVVLVAVFGAGSVGAAACIADLPANAPAITGTGLCGNGIIDLDAGEQCDLGLSSVAPGACSSTCQMVCPGGLVWPGNHHCYWRSAKGTATALDPDAINQCGPLGHVATFASEDEFSAVVAFVGQSAPSADPPPSEAAADASDAGDAEAGASYLWVGLTTESSRSYIAVVDNEPGWQTTCSGCFVHGMATIPLPRTADPTPAQQCVAASADPADSTWYQYPCRGAQAQVICEREPIGRRSEDCNDGGECIDLVATYGRKRYFYSQQLATADEAVASCTQLGGRLLVLESRDEREQLWYALAQGEVPPDRLWIGLRWLTSGADAGGGEGGAGWFWEDGTPDHGTYPSPWGDRQPLPPDAGLTPRAYMRAYSREIDSTLARNDEHQTRLAYVCEWQVGMGDAGTE